MIVDFFEMLKSSLDLPEPYRSFLIALIAVFTAALLNLLIKRSIDRLQRRAAETAGVWDDAMLRALDEPLRLIVWGIGVLLAAKIIVEVESDAFTGLLYTTADLTLVFALTWFLLRTTNEVERNVFARKVEDESSRMDQTTAEALAKLMRASIVITGILIALQTIGISIAGLLAFGGMGGIAVGFAARDLLANFFGGLTIYMDRPFAVGDWVRSPDREIEGIVESIGWRSTRIRTFDKRPLYVPNAVFTNVLIENPSRMTNRRINETLGVRYDDMGQVAGITEEVSEMLRGHEAIDESKTLMVHLDSFGAHSLDFFIYCFTYTTDWQEFHRIKQDVLLRIAAIVEARGAEFAFPTQTLHIEGPVPGAGPADG